MLYLALFLVADFMACSIKKRMQVVRNTDYQILHAPVVLDNLISGIRR